MEHGILLSGADNIDFMIHGVCKYSFFFFFLWITTTHVCLLIVLLSSPARKSTASISLYFLLVQAAFAPVSYSPDKPIKSSTDSFRTMQGT